MPNFNKVFLMGNLTRDPQLRYVSNQTPVVEFGLAVNRKWKTPQGEDKEEVCFVDCTAWAKAAETINQYCKKGKPIFIEGRLRYESWDDKQSGAKRSKLVVVVEGFQFVGARDDAGGGESPPRQQSRLSPGAPTSKAFQEAKAGAGGDGDVDDIPF